MGKAGKALKTVLEDYGISQTKLAAVLGIGRSNIYRWVNEVRDPNSETVISIVKALDELNPDASEDFRQLYFQNSEPSDE